MNIMKAKGTTKANKKENLIPISIYCMIIAKYFIWGIVLGVIFYPFYFFFLNYLDSALLPCIKSILLLFIEGILLAVYLAVVVNYRKFIFKSYRGRLDFKAWSLLGFSCPFFIHLADNFFLGLLPYKLLAIQVIPFIVFVSWIYSQHLNVNHNSKNESSKSIFLSDDEIQSEDSDCLGYKKLAADFAAKIYNNNSSDSLIWGVEAPWGTGKSSF